MVCTIMRPDEVGSRSTNEGKVCMYVRMNGQVQRAAGGSK